MADQKKSYQVAVATNDTPRTSLSDFLTARNATSSDSSENTTDADTQASTDDATDAGSTDDTEANEDGASVFSSAEEDSDGEGSDSDDSSNEGADDSRVFNIKGKKVAYKDLVNSYETREEISKKFNEIGKREQRIKQAQEKTKKEREEINYINEKFEEMHEQVLQGNPLAALQIALTMANPPEGTKHSLKELVNQAITIADNFHGMSEEEQKLFLEKEELKQKERKLNREEKKRKQEDEERELRRFYDGLLERHSLTDDELDQALEDINNDDKYREVLEKKTDPKERISYCASWVVGKRLSNTIVQGIAQVDKNLAKDDKFRLALLDYVDPKCTVNDVAQIVKEFVRQSGSANGTSAASTQSVAPKKPTTSNRAPTEKPKAEEKKAPVTSGNWRDMIARHSS